MSGYDQPYTLVGDVAESWNASSSNSVTNPDGSITTTVGNQTIITPAPTFLDQLMSGLLNSFKSFFNILATKGVLLGLLLVLVDWVITFFLELIGTFLKMSDLSDMINQLPNKDLMGYFFYLGAVDYGLPLILAAYLLKFFIRRLPFVG